LSEGEPCSVQPVDGRRIVLVRGLLASPHEDRVPSLAIPVDDGEYVDELGLGGRVSGRPTSGILTSFVSRDALESLSTVD